MKTDIHPEYQEVTVHCSCGNEFQTRSTATELRVELCSACHPFYTGKQKLVDTGGRIDRFERRYGRRKKAAATPAEEPVAETPAPEEPVAEKPAPEEPAESPAAAEDAPAAEGSVEEGPTSAEGAPAGDES